MVGFGQCVVLFLLTLKQKLLREKTSKCLDFIGSNKHIFRCRTFKRDGKEDIGRICVDIFIMEQTVFPDDGLSKLKI